MKTFEIIRRERRRLGLSLAAFGHATGFDVPLLSKYERGLFILPNAVEHHLVVAMDRIGALVGCIPFPLDLRDAPFLRALLARWPNETPTLTKERAIELMDEAAGSVEIKWGSETDPGFGE